MDERSFVTKDETSGKTRTSNSRTARLGTRSFYLNLIPIERELVVVLVRVWRIHSSSLSIGDLRLISSASQNRRSRLYRDIIIGRLWITLAFMVLSESRKSITNGTQTFIGAFVSSGAG